MAPEDFICATNCCARAHGLISKGLRFDSIRAVQLQRPIKTPVKSVSYSYISQYNGIRLAPFPWSATTNSVRIFRKQEEFLPLFRIQTANYYRFPSLAPWIQDKAFDPDPKVLLPNSITKSARDLVGFSCPGRSEKKDTHVDSGTVVTVLSNGGMFWWRTLY